MANLFKPDVIEFVQGEKGETYPITLFNKDGSDASLIAYTAATFTIISSIDGTTIKGPISLTLAGGNILDWLMAAADTNISDSLADKDHVGIIELTAAGIIRRVTPNPIVRVIKNKVTAFP